MIGIIKHTFYQSDALLFDWSEQCLLTLHVQWFVLETQGTVSQHVMSMLATEELKSSFALHIKLSSSILYLSFRENYFENDEMIVFLHSNLPVAKKLFFVHAGRIFFFYWNALFILKFCHRFKTQWFLTQWIPPKNYKLLQIQ